MLSDCQQFKAEFLAKCAEAGLTTEETHQVVKQAIELREKQALPSVTGAVRNVVGTGKDIAGTMWNVGKPFLFGVPIVGGGLLGYGAAQLNNLDDEDPDEVKTREKIQEYQLAAQRARLQSYVKKLQTENKPRRPML